MKTCLNLQVIKTGLILFLLMLFPLSSGLAQEGQSQGPVYVVQEGDSLWDIALRFGITLDELKLANGISDANQLMVGSKLIIPGLEGIEGELVTQRVPYGETLRSLSRGLQVPDATLRKLNHLTSPAELYAGANLILPQQSAELSAGLRTSLASGQSLLELAVSHNTNPWSIMAANQLSRTWEIVPGDVLRVAGSTGSAAGPGALPEMVSQVELKPQPLVQGKAAVIQLKGAANLQLSGSLAGHELHFFSQEEGSYVGMQGLHALTEPGLYPLTIKGKLPEGEPYYGAEFTFSQSVYIKDGGYYFDPVLTVSPETIDPAVTKPEDAEWTALAKPFTSEKLWDGVFQSPASPPYEDCWPSLFGNRRSYNGSAYIYFHTGLDFCGGVGTPILAPAAGKVIFTGPLTVRGNATMIDHGWGVYSGYMHQDQILVEVGDLVQPGQEIGLVGGTGRVTGAHLHFEIWVAGVQVDPMDWLSEAFP